MAIRQIVATPSYMALRTNTRLRRFSTIVNVLECIAADGRLGWRVLTDRQGWRHVVYGGDLPPKYRFSDRYTVESMRLAKSEVTP